MTDIDKIALAGAKAKGKRPYFLAEKQTEQVLSVAMSLAMELNVVRERMATLECLLEQKGVLSRQEIEAFNPDKDEVAKRSIATQEYLARILRIMQQDKEEMLADDDDVETVQQKLTR
ncbi:hypothetical protein E2K93_09340 [Thalassotalea sp. HSM 43]|uniref:hypothetical protein n=1 Tax=Thalassotalea sp. HSM 43 TaxID=2552945 RepID=UPI0010803AEF|nr:hypothetical protein [Thalassotalea sp. HSM 43]QBY04579.1 hypothetical protein E2K93_09340 [Thalassotalea sp. HSM 43]